MSLSVRYCVTEDEEVKWMTDQLSRTWRAKTVQLLLGQIRYEVGFEHRPLDKKLFCSDMQLLM